MVWHPLLSAVLFLDVLGLLVIALATVSALRIVIRRSSEQGPSEQADFERKERRASAHARIGLALLSLSTLVFIAGITGVLPKIVPGAMCGTGVLQATQGAAGRALALRGLALALLAAWHLLDRLNRSTSDSARVAVAARSLLLASPVAVLAVYDTLQAILRLDVNRPVDCCSMVYGKIRSADQAGGLSAVPDAYWVWGLVLGAMAIILLGVNMWRSRRPLGARTTGPGALLAALWVSVAATGLVRSLAPYLHGVPQHRCPWCLFLPQHKMVGYLLFGCLILVLLEAGAAFLCSLVASSFPDLETETRRRTRNAGWRLVFATVLFLAISGLPPILYRLTTGTWMG
jgi:hypothetical protein